MRHACFHLILRFPAGMNFFFFLLKETSAQQLSVVTWARIWTLQSFYHHFDVTCICVVRSGKRASLLHPSPPLPAPLHNLPYGVFTLTAALFLWLRWPARQLQTEIRTWFIFPSKHFSTERQLMKRSKGKRNGQIERHRGHCLPADCWIGIGSSKGQQMPVVTGTIVYPHPLLLKLLFFRFYRFKVLAWFSNYIYWYMIPLRRSTIQTFTYKDPILHTLNIIFQLVFYC